MTPTQGEMVQKSFSKVAPIADQAAALVYGRLFEIAPAVKPLFRGDMKEQGKKLMGTLAVVVGGLTRLETILPAASATALPPGTARTAELMALPTGARSNVAALPIHGRPTPTCPPWTRATRSATVGASVKAFLAARPAFVRACPPKDR